MTYDDIIELLWTIVPIAILVALIYISILYIAPIIIETIFLSISN